MSETKAILAPNHSARWFICGVTGSGKTEFLKRHCLSHVKRLMVCDQTGEWEGQGHDVVEGYTATAKKLSVVAQEDEWTFVAYLEPEELSDLSARLLCPTPNIRDGYAAKIGGMALMVDEVDVIMPQGAQDTALKNLWRRGRHAGISIFAATQRPGDCNRQITSMSQWVAILYQDEPRDVKYLRDRLGKDRADRALSYATHPYHAYLYNTAQRRGYFVEPDGTTTPDGRNRGDTEGNLFTPTDAADDDE